MMINLFSPSWNIADSYGRVANELADNLEAMGQRVNFFGTDAPDKPIQLTFGGIFMGYPTSMGKWEALAMLGKRISLSMFESDKLPPHWVENINKCHAAIVPSKWLVDVYQKCGVNVPIHVIPLGMSKAFTYKPRENHDKFRVVAIGDGGHRKGSMFAMFAFIAAFGDRDDVELVIKARSYPRTNFSNENIKYIIEDYTDEQMNALYQSADMMIFPSCGEGFGLPPIEFAKTGGIVAATNWSSMTDYISEIGIPIDYEMATAWEGNQRLKGIGRWANVNIQELANALKKVSEMSLSVRNEWGKQASDYVTEHFDWRNFSEEVYQVWEGIDAHSNTIR